MQPPLWLKLLLQAALIVLSAFLAASGASLPLLNEAALRRQAEEGDRTAARLLRLTQSAARLLPAFQTCAALAGFLGAAFAADHFAGPLSDYFALRCSFSPDGLGAVHAACVGAVTLVLSLLTLALGQTIPRRLAVRDPDRAARLTCGLSAALAAVCSPLHALLTAAADGVLRLVHIDPGAAEDRVSEEGIRMMVDIGEEKGAIESGEKEMIENIFEFNNTTAEDVMVHRTDMVMLWVEDTEADILAAIEESGLSRFPVYEQDADDIIGILNTRDWLLNARNTPPKPLRELLRKPYFVPESVRADVLFRDMQSRKVHLSIVVDEYGGTAGLVTMEDLLEEIVGNIYDEFDPLEDQEVVPLGENLWRIAGGAELDDIAAALELAFPEDEESETLGGLVFAQLSVIPEDGSHPEVDVYGLHIRVEELSDRRVEWALVSKLPPAPAEEPPSSK